MCPCAGDTSSPEARAVSSGFSDISVRKNTQGARKSDSWFPLLCSYQRLDEMLSTKVVKKEDTCIQNHAKTRWKLCLNDWMNVWFVLLYVDLWEFSLYELTDWFGIMASAISHSIFPSGGIDVMVKLLSSAVKLCVHTIWMASVTAGGNWIPSPMEIGWSGSIEKMESNKTSWHFCQTLAGMWKKPCEIWGKCSNLVWLKITKYYMMEH